MGEKLARRPRDSLATKARIKAGIIALVERHPLADLTIQHICETAGITHGGFYFHYANKETVVTEIAEEWLRELKIAVLAVPENDVLAVELHQMIRAYVDGYSRNIELTKVVYSLDPVQSGIRNTYSHYHNLWLYRLEARILVERQRRGLDVGAEWVLAHALTAALEGLCIKSFLIPDPGLAARRATLSHEILRIWHRAVTGQDPITGGR